MWRPSVVAKDAVATTAGQKDKGDGRWGGEGESEAALDGYW